MGVVRIHYTEYLDANIYNRYPYTAPHPTFAPFHSLTYILESTYPQPIIIQKFQC